MVQRRTDQVQVVLRERCCLVRFIVTGTGVGRVGTVPVGRQHCKGREAHV